MKYDLLAEILPYLDEYEHHPDAERSPAAFAAWLAVRTHGQAAAAPEVVPPAPGGRGFTEAVAVGRLLVFLNRYVRGYTRRALAGTPLGSVDEFVYMVVLRGHGPLSKTALIHENRHEKPTGMEIIRRLLQAGYVVQEQHPTDRRGRQLRLTAAGHAVLAEVQGRMQAVSEILPGKLAAEKRRLLLSLLEELEDFHQELLQTTRGETFEAVVEQAQRLRNGRPE